MDSAPYSCEGKRTTCHSMATLDDLHNELLGLILAANPGICSTGGCVQAATPSADTQCCNPPTFPALTQWPP
ncbi:hypothetical protein WJX72_000091 [[Myrmecia] bisecta]|uniref:Uncharacterized protein n=1 Tax=[Myrmecia] bisecta TaxID=41462 RepID=A0AAW1PGF2_9CHLO